MNRYHVKVRRYPFKAIFSVKGPNSVACVTHVCSDSMHIYRFHSNWKGDGISDEYSKEVFSLGLLYMEYHDAIKEGDGLHVLRCWKYLLLLFKASQKKSYSTEAFQFLCQYHFYLPPQQAQQLLYSRFINVHGREGHNIPCDLHMEHLNRTIKDELEHLGANKMEQAITRASKCSHLINSLLYHVRLD